MKLVTDQRRITEARQKLQTLKSLGYRYIVTADDGETWIGSHLEPGLEIDLLMQRSFVGRITLNPDLRGGMSGTGAPLP